MLAVAGDDGDLLTVLPQGIELVLEGRLDLLARNVGQLRLCDQRLGLGPDELLLKDNDARRVGVLVLELGDLISDLLLAWELSAWWSDSAGSAGEFSRSRLGCTEASMLRMLLMVTRY